jgi:cbb3-type cytochrome oxidase maturation protein
VTALVWLVPIALLLGGLGLAAFLWSLGSGQYEDLEGAGWRALDDERGPGRPPLPRRQPEAAQIAQRTKRAEP